MAGLNKSNLKQRSAKEVIKRLPQDLLNAVPYMLGVGWDDPHDNLVYEGKRLGLYDFADAERLPQIFDDELRYFVQDSPSDLHRIETRPNRPTFFDAILDPPRKGVYKNRPTSYPERTMMPNTKYPIMDK